MKKIKYIAGLVVVLGLVAFASCSDKDDIFHPWDPTEVIGIDMQGVEDGVLPLYTGGKHQIVLKYTPENSTNIKDLKLKYASSDEKLFTVNAGGEITVGTEEGDGILSIVGIDNPEIQFACAVVIRDEFFPITVIKVDEKLKDYVGIVGQVINLAGFVSVEPSNASIPKVSYSIKAGEEFASLSEAGDGVLTMSAEGSVTIKIAANDGVSTVAEEVTILIKAAGEATYLDRTGWGITAPFKAAIEGNGSVVGDYNLILDGNNNTNTSFVKPGKKSGGVEVPKGAQIYCDIDMLKEQKFNVVTLRHRTNGGSKALRLRAANLLGSSDGKDYKIIKENVAIDIEINEVSLILDKEVSYQYLKMEFVDWDKNSGNTIQMSELNVGTLAPAK